MNLEALRKHLKELAEGLAALETKATADGSTDEDVAALEARVKEIEQVERKIKAFEAAEQVRARAAVPANAPVVTEERAAARVEEVRKLTTSEKVGIMCFSMAKAYVEEGSKAPKATFKAMEDAGYGALAQDFADATKRRALSAGSASAGGVLIPEDMSSDIIDILRPTTTFLQGGPRRVPLTNGSYKLPAAASGSTATWRGEGKAIQVSQPTFKDINLTSKFLDAMVPITNQLLRWSLPDVRAWVERDMSLEMGTKLDLAAYFGTGNSHQPLGIRNISGITEEAADGGTGPTIAQIEGNARTLELSMEGRNLPMMGAAWVMAPRTKKFLADMRDTNGNRYFPELQGENPRWRMLPVYSTTQVSITGGATTNESEILLVNFGDVFFGESRSISFAVSTDASYVNASGATVSAFQNDLTLIKASLEADVDLRYLEAVAVLTGVQWGA